MTRQERRHMAQEVVQAIVVMVLVEVALELLPPWLSLALLLGFALWVGIRALSK